MTTQDLFAVYLQAAKEHDEAKAAHVAASKAEVEARNRRHQAKTAMDTARFKLICAAEGDE